jgi:poly(A) polymerase
VDQARFRAGFDFLCLRAEVGEVDIELADWWEEFQHANDDARISLIQTVKPAPRAVRADGSEAPRKRTRRRRKPAGGSADGNQPA